MTEHDNDVTDRGEGFALVAVFVGMLALIAAVIGMGFAMRAVDEAGSTGDGEAKTVEVTLADMSISPKAITVESGGTLEVNNAGAMTHNLTVKGTSVHTADLAAGARTTLDLSSLAAGDYTVICSLPGHEASGMTASLRVGSGGGSAAPSAPQMTAAEMDKVMKARTAAFPAKTKGTGAVDVAPTVLADGTKSFDLTASVFDWEIEPGKVVQAWGYNHMVPGPTLRVEVGDRIRVVLHNELPESTVIHFHGLKLPNAMDGVPDITQPPVKPGASFTYEFTAAEPMVGMYHSHHDAAKQVANGLLGAIYVGHLPLPAGVPTPAVDVPMVLNDSGTIGFSLNGKSFPATAPIVAARGTWVRVDYLNEGAQIHPMHLHGMPQLVFAQDGYPRPQPQWEDTVSVAPGQRVSVLVHATELGTWAWHCHILPHAEREDGMFGMVTALVVQ